MNGEPSEQEHQAEINRLNKVHTTELLKQDLKAEMALQTYCHKAGMLKQIACHKAENKQNELKHKEEIQMHAASQIEEINLIKAVHNAMKQKHKNETRRKDFLQTEAMVDQAECHRAEMKRVKGQYEAVILDQVQEIKRQKKKIKRLRKELDDKHRNCSAFTLTISSTLTLVAALFTLVGSVLTFVASRQ